MEKKGRRSKVRKTRAADDLNLMFAYFPNSLEDFVITVVHHQRGIFRKEYEGDMYIKTFLSIIIF